MRFTSQGRRLTSKWIDNGCIYHQSNRSLARLQNTSRTSACSVRGVTK